MRPLADPDVRAEFRRSVAVVTGMLDPKTRADEVRLIRARCGLPLGMEIKPELERRRPIGEGAIAGTEPEL